MSNIKKITTGVIILALVGIGFFVFYRYKMNGFFLKTKPLETIVENPATSLSNLKDANKIKFPQVITEVSMGLDKIPTSMAFFLPEDKSAVQVSALTLLGKSKGYQVVFKHQNSVLETYKYFKNLYAAKYDFVGGRYNDSAGVMVIGNKDYTFEFSFKLYDNVNMTKQITEVTIRAYPKKS